MSFIVLKLFRKRLDSDRFSQQRSGASVEKCLKIQYNRVILSRNPKKTLQNVSFSGIIACAFLCTVCVVVLFS